ncbi:MAG: OmpA family protein [Xanthomonadaceae bacterium]|nr:OmpA family protein [Xanthomonadaceae bacterium]MDP2185136.1 OmpA family protein [Xanthomonadales bacterium]MDZ4115545.1 OmpA family protein [Xanthomonadaceae bacterium]MDZ4378004.1 OmpA family protein [Xanthomonadaceae bacterium]
MNDMYSKHVIRALLMIAAILLTAPAHSGSDADHPLLSRYPGAQLRDYQQVDYETIEVPMRRDASVANAGFVLVSKIGDVTRHYYELRNVSTLKLYENYHDAVRRSGLTITYTCKLDECGDPSQAEQLGGLMSLTGSVYNQYRKPYFLVAEGKAAKGPIIVALFIGGYEDEVSIQQVVVESAPLETGLIKVNATYLTTPPVPARASAATEKHEEDSPLLPRFPGAKLQAVGKTDHETLSLPKTIVDASGKAAMLDLVGDVHRHYYSIEHVSTLKLHENYKAALAKAGFATLFSCELDKCGTKDQGRQLGALVALRGDVYNDYQKPYYLLAKRDTSDGTLYIALFIGGYDGNASVQQVVLHTLPLQTGLVVVTADSLSREIEATGKATVYGIYFDTDQSAIKPTSKPALDAIAGSLRAKPDLKFHVVGHTDATGNLAHNLDLSQRRAEAVVAALVKDYTIAPARLAARGLASFAPVASNTDDAGRARNRRVELVLQ